MAKKEKGPMTPKQQKIRKVLSIIASVLGILVVVVTLLVSIITIKRTQEKDSVASLFGYAFMPVVSDSMEPTIMTGDLIITKLYKGDGSDLKKGDIVTFTIWRNSEMTYNTHRIDEVVETEYEDGVIGRFYYTKGDNNPRDGMGLPKRDEITQSPVDIKAVYTGVHLKGLGQAITKLQTDPKFYFLVIVTPLILLFVVYVFFFVRSLVQMKMEKGREEAFAAATAAAMANMGAPKDPSRVSLDELSDDEKLQLLLELQAKRAAEKAQADAGDSSQLKDKVTTDKVSDETATPKASTKVAVKKAAPKVSDSGDIQKPKTIPAKSTKADTSEQTPEKNAVKKAPVKKVADKKPPTDTK